MGSINLGIIGCGAVANRYYLPAFKKLAHVLQQVYFIDKNLDQARDLAMKFGSGKIYDDYHTIIDKVDGAIVALPHFLHYPVTMDLLNARVNVLCEKPLAESAKEVKEMIKAAEQNDVALCVNNTMRVLPSVRKVMELIASQQIGQLEAIKFCEGDTFAWPSSTGFYVDPRVSSKGVLLDLGPHVIDLICWWLGEKPKLIDYKDDSFGGPESVTRIKAHACECNIDVLLNRLSDLENRFQIIGKLGTIEGKLFEWDKIKIRLNSGNIINEKIKTKIKNYSEFVIPIVGNFLKVIEGREDPIVSATDVQNSIELIEECYVNRSRFELPWYEESRKSSKTMGKILVTGATGFVGGSIVENLHLTDYRKVRASIRQWSSAARLGRFPVDIVKMDVMEKDEIEKALDGVTKIIHCAKGPKGVTVQGTRNLLEIALKKGIRRFIHLSTTEVYGDVSGEINEDTPFNYTGNKYNESKIDAEKACWEYSKKGLPVTVIRPSIVYGPFSKNWSIHFARMLIGRKWGIYEKYGDGKCNLVYIDDLVRAILLALDNEKAVGQAFNISGPEVITWNEYFIKYNEIMGLPPLQTINATHASLRTAITEPVRMLGVFVRDHFMGPVKKIAETFDLANRIMKLTENALITTPCPDELKLFNKNAVFSWKKSRQLLRFNASVSVTEGLHRTVGWLKHQGFF